LSITSYPPRVQPEWLLEVAFRGIDGSLPIRRFGFNDAVGTNFTAIAEDGIYMMPAPAGATTLRIEAGGSPDDDVAGIGAQEITLTGLDENGDLAVDVLATAGAAASADTVNTYLRLNNVRVTKSGSRGDFTGNSHVGDIHIENSGSIDLWGTIVSGAFDKGASQNSMYTVPNGFDAFLLDFEVTMSRAIDVILISRSGLLETAEPYSAMRVQHSIVDADVPFYHVYPLPVGPFPPGTDIGLLAKGVGLPTVSAQMNLVLRTR
jgi:hypothetical protein